MTPQRIQRRRTKGWRMPENTIYVGRPGPWGNPFIVNPNVKPGSRSGAIYFCVPTIEDAVECFRLLIEQKPGALEAVRKELRGKNLACFCKIGDPCHADVLLELANARTPGNHP